MTFFGILVLVWLYGKPDDLFLENLFWSGCMHRQPEYLSPRLVTAVSLSFPPAINGLSSAVAPVKTMANHKKTWKATNNRGKPQKKLEKPQKNIVEPKKLTWNLEKP